MESRNLFKKYYSRLAWEGILKALICGFIVGFAANFIVSLVTYCVDYDGLWLSIGIGLAVVALTTPIFYFIKFRPTTQKMASRIDELGLEERLITMTELEKDESYIALRQREDAKERLGYVNSRQIKMVMSRAAIITMAITAACGISMTAVSKLSAEDVIRSPGEIINPDPQDTFLAVSYMVEEGGYIDGESEQLIFLGEDATPVVAVAEDGWMFQEWSDGTRTPDRHDLSIKDELLVTAIFVQVEEGENGDGDGDGEEGDQAQDEPGQPGDNGQSKPGEDDGGNGAGPGEGNNNNIIDGNTDYRDVFENYYEQVKQYLAEGKELTPEMRAFIEAYFGALA